MSNQFEDSEVEPLIDKSSQSSDATISIFKIDDKQSAMACIFNFVNSSLGSAVLAVPYVFSLCGYVFAPFIEFTFCALAIITFFMLQKVSEYTQRYQFNAICETLFPGTSGKAFGVICAICQMIYVAGGLISYTVVVRDNLFFFDLATEGLYANIVVAAILLFLIMPLTYLKNLEKLRFNSFLVVIVLSYILVCLIGYFINGEIHHTNAKVKPFNANITILNAFSLTIAGFNSHYNFLNLYCELRDRQQNCKKVIYGTSVFLVIIYLMFGYFGYLTYGEDTQPDILSNLTRRESIFTYIANVMMICYMICHYPLPCYAMRRSIESFIYGKNQVPKNSNSIIISTIIVVSCLIIGIFVSSIDNILDFTSSLAGGALGFIFPPIFLIKVYNKQKKQTLWLWVYLVLGITITIAAFASACLKWF